MYDVQTFITSSRPQTHKAIVVACTLDYFATYMLKYPLSHSPQYIHPQKITFCFMQRVVVDISPFSPQFNLHSLDFRIQAYILIFLFWIFPFTSRFDMCYNTVIVIGLIPLYYYFQFLFAVNIFALFPSISVEGAR